jgi:AcrR family transcriptional regulator
VTVTAPPGLRERKKEQTRRALEDAALELFARQGFDATTVDEIAAACDVSTRTFFRYFATKEDVLLGDKPERFAELIALLEDAPADEPPLRSLRRGLDALVAAYAQDKERLVLRSQIIARTPTLRVNGAEARLDKEEALVQALQRRDEAAGVPPRPLELRLAVGVSGAAFRAALETWLAAGGEGDLFDAVAEAYDRLGAGLDRPA